MPTGQKNIGHVSALTISGLTPGRKIVACNMHVKGGINGRYTVLDYPRVGIRTNLITDKPASTPPELIVKVRDQFGRTTNESLKWLGIVPLCTSCMAWSWWRFTVDHRKLHVVNLWKARELTLADDRDFYIMPELELAGCHREQHHPFPRLVA